MKKLLQTKIVLIALLVAAPAVAAGTAATVGALEDDDAPAAVLPDDATPAVPGAWRAAIARNECGARIRGRMGPPLALVDESAAAAADVEHVAGQRAEIEALCAALAELPQQQREALVLREFYGLS